MIMIEQIKAARALLGIKQTELAKKAGISIATLNNIERGAQTDPKISTITSIQQALEKDGIVFINDAFEGIGVHLKPKNGANEYSTILIIDDSKSDRTLYKSWLSKAPGKKYRIYQAENARAGFDAFVEYKPECIILDFMMYGADGFQLLAALRREHTKIPPIIFVTGMHNDVMEESANSQGVHKYLNKQMISKEDLVAAVTSALNVFHNESERL